jgi:hypothetical protein
MTQEHPVVKRYLMHFDHAMEEFDFPGREEVTHEIRNHIAEARTAGKDLDAVLQSLGSADVLARAYAVELLLNRRTSRRVQRLGGSLKLAGLVGATSFATFVIVTILGTTGIVFLPSGVALIVIGMLEQGGIHLRGVQMNGMAPAWAMMLGIFVWVVGILALFGLRLYVRFVIRTLKTFRSLKQPASTLA